MEQQQTPKIIEINVERPPEHIEPWLPKNDIGMLYVATDEPPEKIIDGLLELLQGHWYKDRYTVLKCDGRLPPEFKNCRRGTDYVQSDLFRRLKLAETIIGYDKAHFELIGEASKTNIGLEIGKFPYLGEGIFALTWRISDYGLPRAHSQLIGMLNQHQYQFPPPTLEVVTIANYGRYLPDQLNFLQKLARK